MAKGDREEKNQNSSVMPNMIQTARMSMVDEIGLQSGCYYARVMSDIPPYDEPIRVPATAPHSRLDTLSPLDLLIDRTHSLRHSIDLESDSLQTGSQRKQRSAELPEIEHNKREFREGRRVSILDARLAILPSAHRFPPRRQSAVDLKCELPEFGKQSDIDALQLHIIG